MRTNAGPALPFSAPLPDWDCRRYLGTVCEGKDFANNALRVMNFRSVVWAFADSLNAAAQ